MVRRLYIKATHDFVVQTDMIENRIMEIVQQLYEERNSLRLEVDLLRSKLNEVNGCDDSTAVGQSSPQHEVIESKLAEHTDEVTGTLTSSELVAIELPKEKTPSDQKSFVLDELLINQSGVGTDDVVHQKVMSDFVALLKSTFPLRLSDEEMVRLATLSKLRTEIEQRHMDMEDGKIISFSLFSLHNFFSIVFNGNYFNECMNILFF